MLQKDQINVAAFAKKFFFFHFASNLGELRIGGVAGVFAFGGSTIKTSRSIAISQNCNNCFWKSPNMLLQRVIVGLVLKEFHSQITLEVEVIFGAQASLVSASLSLGLIGPFCLGKRQNKRNLWNGVQLLVYWEGEKWSAWIVVWCGEVFSHTPDLHSKMKCKILLKTRHHSYQNDWKTLTTKHNIHISSVHGVILKIF